MHKFLSAIVIASGALLFTASQAMASSSPQYPGGGIAGGQQTSGGSLPFTGSDLVLYAIVGLAIISCGVALHRMSRPARQYP
jgi:hypothetical protein